jgi:ankyrin repeat protein
VELAVSYLVGEEILEIKNNFGQTALDSAAGKGQIKIVKELLRSGASNKLAISWAAEKGAIEVVNFLLGQRPPVDPMVTRGLDKLTPLHFAARQGHLAVVKRLLQRKGVDINILDATKKTPAHYAEDQGHLKVVIFLIEKGPKIADKIGWRESDLGGFERLSEI